MSVSETTGPIKFVAINTASTDTALVAAVTDRKIRVLAFVIYPTANATLTFQSTTATALTGDIVVTIANDPKWKGEYCPTGHFETVAGELLNLQQAGVVQLDGYLVYQEVQ